MQTHFLSERALRKVWRRCLLTAFGGSFICARTLVCTCALICAWPAAARTHRREMPAADVRQVSVERTGQIATRSGLHLHLSTDVGNVQIFTDATGQVSYSVRVSADASEAGAADLVQHYGVTARATDSGVVLTGAAAANTPEDVLWVEYEIHVPRRYSLEITTQAGNIQTQDIVGHISLTTGGGNITAGRVGPNAHAGDILLRAGENYSARLETDGGHITVGDVAGDLRASTSGGHISTGDVRGEVTLHTGGGHIHTGSIAGGQVATDGGNIVVERSSAGLVATTVGGQISVGEITGGPVRAQTGGGAIRIARVVGPTEVESTRGNIALTCLDGPLHASTSSGNITAWFLDESAEHVDAPNGAPQPAKHIRRHEAPSVIETGDGNIVVYLPREMPLTIEATVDHSPLHQIVADPSLPMKVDYQTEAGGAVRAQCDLNGGGDVLRLKADSGSIVLKYGDPAVALRYTQQQMEQLRGQMASQMQSMLNSDMLGQLARQAVQNALQNDATDAQNDMQAAAQQAQQAVQEAQQQETDAGRLERYAMRLEQIWWGDVHVDADVQQKKLVARVTPEYPDVARQAGVSGTVTLRVEIGTDGKVQDIEPISGPPLLVRAATEAVAQWRYAPTLVDGNAVDVVTTVSVEFNLSQQ